MTGVGALVGMRLRRDGVQLAAWILGTVALAAATVVGVRTQFPTDADRRGLLATALANPVILLFRGLPSGNDEGAFAAFLIAPFLMLLAALMSTFLAVRHTRADEETGRAELIAATPAGRSAPVFATAVHGILADVVLGALVTGSFLALGYAPGGSLALGLSATATGAVFLSVGLVASEIARTSRGANAAAVWAVLVSLLVCGLGNALGTPSADLKRMTSAPLAWASPFGWAENVRAFDADDLRPLLLSLAVAAAGLAGAFALHRGRDLGAAMLPAPRGPAHAGRALAGPLGLAWREARGAVLGWMIGGFIVGVMSTRLSAAIAQISDTIPSVQTLLRSLAAQGSPARGAVAVFFTLAGILAACAGVQMIARLRQDEAAGLTEPLLSGAVSRVRWFGAGLVLSAAALATVLVAAVAGAALGVALTDGAEGSLVRDAAVSAAGQALAAAVIAMVAAGAFVVLPRASVLIGWALVAVATVVGLFGPLIGLPDAVVRASPLASVPTVGDGGVDPRAGVLWAVVLAVLCGSALVGIRRRELKADR